MKKRFLSLFLVVCLTLVSFPFVGNVSETSITSDAATKNYTAFQQNDLAWKDYNPSATYAAAHGGSVKGCAIGPQGCGLMSLVNAIYYLNGNTIDIKQLSDWAYAGSAFGGGPNGTWTGSMRNVLYPNVTSAFGAKYGFKGVGGGYGNAANTKLKNHLAKGGVAIGHVKNHFICLAAYDAASDRILVLDSGADFERRFTSEGGNWLSFKELSSDSSAMIVDW